MDVLAGDSAEDITCKHQDFEIEMRALRTDATAVGSVEVGRLECVHVVRSSVAVCMCSMYSYRVCSLSCS